MKTDCDKCGNPHPRCDAHTRAGEPCRYVDIPPGMNVCTKHGGKAPQSLKAGARRESKRIVTELYKADPEAVIAAYGVEAIDDPLDVLSRLTASSAHMVEALGQRVNALEEIRYENKTGGEQVRTELKLYMQAMTQTGKFLDMLIKSGFEERRVKISEDTAAVFVTIIQGVLARLDLSPAQAAIAGEVVAEELRAADAQGV